MPVLLGLLGVLTAIAIWYWRARMLRDAAGDLAGMASDVRSAARRFGFRRRTNVHPADSVEDPRLAATGIALAISSIDGPHTATEIQRLTTECRARFRIDASEAEEMIAFGRWLAGQCQTPEEAVRRLSKVVRDKAPEAGSDLVAMAEAVTTADGQIGEREADSLRRVRQTFHLD